jgi:formate dehydrogenase major subunit
LKRHYARYTPELVERFCGVPRERFLKIAETFC